MAILSPDSAQIPGDDKHVKSPNKRVLTKEYALATFIMGCLVQQQVIPMDETDSDYWSDFQCGVQIISAVLKSLRDSEEWPVLPFDW